MFITGLAGENILLLVHNVPQTIPDSFPVSHKILSDLVDHHIWQMRELFSLLRELFLRQIDHVSHGLWQRREVETHAIDMPVKKAYLFIYRNIAQWLQSMSDKMFAPLMEKQKKEKEKSEQIFRFDHGWFKTHSREGIHHVGNKFHGHGEIDSSEPHVTHHIRNLVQHTTRSPDHVYLSRKSHQRQRKK